jgi:hypothetical protein
MILAISSYLSRLQPLARWVRHPDTLPNRAKRVLETVSACRDWGRFRKRTIKHS